MNRKPTARLWALTLALLLLFTACGTTAQPAAGESGQEQVQSTGEAAVSQEESGPTAQPAEGLVFTPGTYTTTQTGHNGYVEVSVTFSQDAITAIETTKSFETAGVSDKALYTDIPNAILETQSLTVDTVAGATISSAAMLRAVEDCVTQAGGDPAAMKTEKPAVEPTEIELSADVVIVGGGGAGLAAAVAATDNNASVIIVEKMGYVGGNTMVSGGIYNAPDPENQAHVEMTPGVAATIEEALAQTPEDEAHAALIAAVQEEYDAYKDSGATYLFDTPNWYALQTWINGDKVADIQLVQTMADNAMSSLEWLWDMGFETKPDIVQGAGSLYQRTHSSVKKLGVGFIDAYMATLESRDAQIIYNTSAQELMLEDGAVVGVKGTDRDGNTYTITAAKGVILSTGGFAANTEMRQQYNTSGKWPDLSTRMTTNLPGMTGDGVVMAQAAGAALRDMERIQLLQTCSPKTGNATHAYMAPLEAQGYLFLNKEGNRFVREDGRRDEICLAAMDQTDGIFYMVQSADVVTDPTNTTDLGGVPLADLIEMEDIYAADTLEELCALTGMDYDNAQAAIDSYNQKVDESAESDEFGRVLFVNKHENGPWYAIPRTPSVHHTMGGVVINTDCQVQGTDGNTITGLYAAGEVVGGIHGDNRLGGNAIVDTVVFGRIAGDMASR